MDEDLGCIEIRDGVVKYSSMTYGQWDMSLDDLVALGEFTNENGPYCADHFWVFVCPDGLWHDVPAGALGLFETMSHIGQRLDFHLMFSLSACPTFASRIMWPSQLAERPLFTFTQIKRSAWDKILHFWEPNKVSVRLTAEVVALARAKQTRSCE